MSAIVKMARNIRNMYILLGIAMIITIILKLAL